MRARTGARVATAAALAAWAALFWFLILDGRIPLYLSSRTAWLAYLGAALATIGAAGYLAFARASPAEPLTRRGVAGIGIFLLPVVLMAALPPATLGTFAAARRSIFSGQGIAAASSLSGEGDLSLVDIAGAFGSPGGARALAARAGTTASFVGFVARDAGQAADEFTLTRFMFTCCPGDALGIQVRVAGAPPGEFRDDDWVRVTGALYPLGTEVVVDAEEVVRVPRPGHPYLNP